MTTYQLHKAYSCTRQQSPLLFTKPRKFDVRRIEPLERPYGSRCGNHPINRVGVVHTEPRGNHATVRSPKADEWRLLRSHSVSDEVNEVREIGHGLLGRQKVEAVGSAIVERKAVSVVAVLGEHEQSTKLLCIFPHESSVVDVQPYIIFVAKVCSAANGCVLSVEAKVVGAGVVVSTESAVMTVIVAAKTRVLAMVAVAVVVVVVVMVMVMWWTFFAYNYGGGKNHYGQRTTFVNGGECLVDKTMMVAIKDAPRWSGMLQGSSIVSHSQKKTGP